MKASAKKYHETSRSGILRHFSEGNQETMYSLSTSTSFGKHNKKVEIQLFGSKVMKVSGVQKNLMKRVCLVF